MDTKLKNENRISFSGLAVYGSGGIIPIALFNIAGILVGLMGNISLGLSAFWLGVILIIPRLWDAVSDPLIGHLSDNARTRFGRRRPFILAGGILVAVFFVVMWWIPKGDMISTMFPTESGFQWFQLGYILFTLLLFFTAYTIFEIPHGALGMEMTNDYHERTRLFSAKSFVGNLFAMSTPWLFALANMEVFRGPGGNEADGMRYVSLLIAAILIPLSFWWFFKLREPGFVKVTKQEKSPFWQDMKHAVQNRNFILLTLTIFTLAMGFNFVNLLGSYIPIFYVFGGDKIEGARLLGINGTIWAVTGVLAVFPLNWISPRIGKRNTLLVAISLMCLAQLSKIVCYNPQYPYLIIIPTFLLSAGMLFFFTLGSSMVGDICDEDELNTGNRKEGSFYSVFWWFIKMGTALASFVAGALIVFTMFDEGQVTKVDALQGTIREMKSQAAAIQKSIDAGGSLLTSETSRYLSSAQNETAEYRKYLSREISRTSALALSSPSEVRVPVQALQEADEFAAGITDSLQKLINNSSSHPDLLKNSFPLIQTIKVIKVKVNADQLFYHLENRDQSKEKNRIHTEELISLLKELKIKIENLDPANVKEIGAIEDQAYLLTRQSPHTLLLMRILEIGLPVLLSLLSVFFITKYSLTESRSHEIKDLLTARNKGPENQNSIV